MKTLLLLAALALTASADTLPDPSNRFYFPMAFTSAMDQPGGDGSLAGSVGYDYPGVARCDTTPYFDWFASIDGLEFPCWQVHGDFAFDSLSFGVNGFDIQAEASLDYLSLTSTGYGAGDYQIRAGDFVDGPVVDAGTYSIDPLAVPEPASVILFGSAVFMLARTCAKRKTPS